MNILCTICMRKGSKGVKGKNWKKINGKPLMFYTIAQAQKSKIFDNIIVSTDSSKIGNMAKRFANLDWFKRKKRLADSKINKLPVIIDALKYAEKFYKKKFETIIDLDVSSPLRKVSDIKKSYKLFKKEKSENLISACNSRRNPYFNIIEKKGKRINLCKKLKKEPKSRQEAPITYDMNASIYIWKKRALLKNKIFTKNTSLYLMKENQAFDIDSELDFKVVQFLLAKRV